MSSTSVLPDATPARDRPSVDHPTDKATRWGVLAVGALGLAFAAFSVWRDVDVSGAQTHSLLVYLLLAVALFIALAFEFVKGMSLIMLILIGTVPTTYALNRAVPDSFLPQFAQTSAAASKIIDSRAAGYAIIGDPRPAVIGFVRDKRLEDGVYPALAALMRDIADQVRGYGSLAAVPADKVGNTRNDMYLTSEALRTLPKVQGSQLSPEDGKVLAKYKSSLDTSTKFIPTWVKIVVALALGLGTMIGWKRIVVTVGEKIGKTHLNYGQGASAELVAMATILAADQYGLPVSTTHVLSSGVAGTMAANGSGVQTETIRNIVLAWLLTLPCAILLSGTLYLIFSRIF